MSKRELTLLSLLCEQIGIQTAVQLEEFKRVTKVSSNEMLIKRLALYVAAGATFEEVRKHERIYN